MSRLRIGGGETGGRVDWQRTLLAAVAERDGARKRIREEWATLSVQDVRQLEATIQRAKEAIRAASERGYVE